MKNKIVAEKKNKNKKNKKQLLFAELSQGTEYFLSGNIEKS